MYTHTHTHTHTNVYIFTHTHTHTSLSWEQEVEDIVKRGVMEGVNPDNISMEVNGRKFAHDKSFGDCAVVMLPTIFGTLPAAPTRKEAFAAVTKLIKTWKPLMVCACVCVGVWVYGCGCVGVGVGVCMCTRLCVCVYIYIDMYVCVC